MLKVVIGALLGGLATSSYLMYPNFSLDTNKSINIVIAMAACIATAIHYDSMKTQRRDRVWEINKSVLLELTHVLSEVMEETEYAIDSEQGHPSDREPNYKIYGQLDQKINYALNVYRPLMSNDLTEEIENMKTINKKIHYEVFNEELENIVAYEQSLAAYKQLYSKLIEFIEENSGLKYT